MQVPFAHNQIELSLGELRVNERESNAMKREVPRGVPWELPFIRHRHHVLVVEMTPSGVATGQALVRRWRLARISIKPLIDDVVIKLLVPKKPGERLPLNRAVLLANRGRRELVIKLIGFGPSQFENCVKNRQTLRWSSCRRRAPTAAGSK